MKNLKFIRYVFIFVCLFGTVGFALGFTKWFNYDGFTYANLPVFPNVLDSFFLIISVCYLGISLLIVELKKDY